MSDQPKALRLAEFCDFNVLYQPAAAELRRLHEESKELRHATGVANQTIAAVVAQRNELLEALKEIDSWLVCACIATPEDMAQSFPHMEKVVSAAIKKAEGV